MPSSLSPPAPPLPPSAGGVSLPSPSPLSSMADSSPHLTPSTSSTLNNFASTPTTLDTVIRSRRSELRRLQRRRLEKEASSDGVSRLLARARATLTPNNNMNNNRVSVINESHESSHDDSSPMTSMSHTDSGRPPLFNSPLMATPIRPQMSDTSVRVSGKRRVSRA